MPTLGAACPGFIASIPRLGYVQLFSLDLELPPQLTITRFALRLPIYRRADDQSLCPFGKPASAERNANRVIVPGIARLTKSSLPRLHQSRGVAPQFLPSYPNLLKGIEPIYRTDLFGKPGSAEREPGLAHSIALQYALPLWHFFGLKSKLPVSQPSVYWRFASIPSILC